MASGRKNKIVTVVKQCCSCSVTALGKSKTTVFGCSNVCWRCGRRTGSSFLMSLVKGLALKHLLKQKGQG